MTQVVDTRAFDLACLQILEDGRCWGEAAEPFQIEDVRALLSQSPPNNFLTRARGSAKTADCALVANSVMLAEAPPGSNLIVLAADVDQGTILLDFMRGFAERTRILRGKMVFTQTTAYAPERNVRLTVMASDAASIWGRGPYFAICDEVAQWPDSPRAAKTFEALASCTFKRHGRLAVITTAGDPAHWSYKLWEHSGNDPAWRRHDVPGPSPWMDADALAAEERRLPAYLFARLFRNEWTGDDDRLTTLHDLRARAVIPQPLPPMPGKQYIIGLDLSQTRDNTVAVVGHGERATEGIGHIGRTHVVVDALRVWHGSPDHPISLDEVESEVVQLAREYRGAKIVLDNWQGAQMAERLQKVHGQRVQACHFTETLAMQVASTLVELFRNKAVSLLDDPPLIDELAHIRLVDAGQGGFRIAHDANRHDDYAVALGLMAIQALRPRPLDLSVSRVLIAPIPPPRFGGSWRR
jgi:phage terminase large subunit-like protein